MRIVLVNWAKIWDGATQGGGVNGYAQSLALELVEQGHEVVYLSGGTAFVPGEVAADGSATPGACAVRRHPDWLGVRVFEVVNSPVTAPAGYQFREPAGEISDAALERELESWARRIAPDVIHFHNIEGFTAGSVAAMVRGCEKRPAVLYSLHNYHTICPQAYLMHQYREPCHDDFDGERCVGCIPGVEAKAERVARATAAAKEQGLTALTVSAVETKVSGPVAARDDEELSPLAGMTLGERVAWLLSGKVPKARERLRANARMREDTPRRGGPPESGPPDAAAVRPPELPGRGAEGGWTGAWIVENDTRGQTASIVGDRAAVKAMDADAPELRPVTNEILARRAEVGEGNDYAKRRRAMVTMLNSCDRVLAVSTFVRDRYESMGVEARKLEVMSIGTRANRVVERRADLVFDPPAFDPVNPRAIRLVFMGYHNVYKGLSMLADAMESLPAHLLSRYHFFMFAQAGESIEWRFRRMEPRLGGLTIHFGYQYYDVPWMLGGKDLGVVPSIWWDNAPQTVFEFFSCRVPVLGAAVGGIPDFVRPGENGLLFRGNDRADLARQLTLIASEPSILTRLRAGVRPPKDIGVHAKELSGLYRTIREAKNRD
ncbi:MAG: glycosyltransferase [Phycisphaerae bacterium]|nr:glycosyltransferase [Phycisphaerae bacterium]